VDTIASASFSERSWEVAPDEQRQHLRLQRAFELAALPEQRRRPAPLVDQLLQHLHPSAPRVNATEDSVKPCGNDLPLHHGVIYAQPS